jgi:hypothetical protein
MKDEGIEPGLKGERRSPVKEACTDQGAEEKGEGYQPNTQKLVCVLQTQP